MRDVIATLQAELSRAFGEMSLAMLEDLLFPGDPSPLVQRRRAQLIISRVRMVAAVFAMLTPLWIPIDLVVFEPRLGLYLAVLRGLATLGFAGLVLSFHQSESMAAAYKALAWLLTIPTLFFLVSHPLLAEFEIDGQLPQMIASGYNFLPFVMVAGLSVFPITAIEGAVTALPLIVCKLAVILLGYRVIPFATDLGALWLLILLAVVATLAGMSQLHFMMQLVAQASHDGLTRGYTRRVGEELLELQFALAKRAGQHLSVAFIDLDDFKAVNDKFGHEEGDRTLKTAAQSMRKHLRRADVMIRWGGEEFIVLMPGTDVVGAKIAMRRIRDGGLGKRPDGSAQTSSIGIAESIADACGDWTDLVEKADVRMYQAKQNGKNRICCLEDMAAE